MFKRVLCSLLLVMFSFICIDNLYAVNSTELIDTPTHSILDYGSYDLQFRVFTGGSLTSKIAFGIFKPLNIGVSWELGNIIGNGNAVVAVPALQVKFNVYEGNDTIPGFSIGYDGQGYYFDEHDSDFLQKGKGVYVVGGREIFVPSLNLNIGLNVNDFKDVALIGFTSLSYMIIEESLMAMLEYDNIGKGADARLNFGVRLWIVENFSIDIAIRHLLTTDEEKFGCERILKISYQSRF